MSDTAIITTHFNWCNYSRPRANLGRFLRQQRRDGHAVFGVEAFLAGQTPVTKGVDGWRQVQVPRHAILFQKEALLNACERFVPDRYVKLVCADADLFWSNPDWLKQTSVALDEWRVVQPFSEGVWHGRGGEEIRRVPSVGSLAQYAHDENQGHPGFALAARRSLWHTVGGLFPYAISGRGDTMGVAGFLGTVLPALAKASLGGTPSSLMEFQAWHEAAALWAECRIGHVPGEVHHDFHGDLANRLYTKRHEFVDGLDIRRDITITEAGYAQWTPEACPKMMAAVADYFRQRNEDA